MSRPLLLGNPSPKSSEIPALFKADTATVSFDAAKAGKLSRGFQDCEQIGSFEKSGVRSALGTPQGIEGSVSSAIEMVGGDTKGRHLCARSGGGSPRFQVGLEGGVGIYDPRGRGGQTSGRVVLFA